MITREQIIAAAKDAGIKAGYLGSHYSGTEALERFYAIAFEAGRVAERREQRQQVKLYEKALLASWPEGAMGDAFDFWNAARKIAATEQEK